MQSITRRNKRIAAGIQNPMPSSQKITVAGINSCFVFRNKKHILNNQ